MHTGQEWTDLRLYQFRAGSAFIDLADINGKIGIERSVAGLKKETNMDHLSLRLSHLMMPRYASIYKVTGLRLGKGLSVIALMVLVHRFISMIPMATALS